MTHPLFAYFWPSFVVGIVIGAIAATYVSRTRPSSWKKWLLFDVAIVMAVLGSLVWSGPLGGGGRYIASVERNIHATLAYYELTQVSARLGRAPLNREVILEGPADEFQRGELARVLGDLPGVSKASWGYKGGAIPIILEGAVVAIAGLLVGLFLAYLLELHRRYNAQWDW